MIKNIFFHNRKQTFSLKGNYHDTYHVVTQISWYISIQKMMYCPSPICYRVTKCAYHVRIIKTAWTSHLKEVSLVLGVVVDDFRHTVPWVLNVIIIPPDVTALGDGLVVGLKLQTIIYLNSAATSLLGWNLHYSISDEYNVQYKLSYMYAC